ncbi:MAG: TldD/PmbA family protein [Thermoleophilaceae bacterium]|nr:TldD/PmbA family protein [Thermoleophilaceae bacterium]
MSAAPDLEQIGARAVEAALARGADQAEAWVERSWSLQIRVYEGAVESLSDSGARGIGLRFLRDGRPGYAYGTDLSDAGVTGLAELAESAARVVDVDEHAGLPEECGAAELEGLVDPAFSEWDTARKVELAVEVERVARSHEGISQVEDTVYADGSETVALVNSGGFSASFESTAAWSYASAFAGEGEDLMTGLGLGIGRGPGEIDAHAVGAEAAERALSLRGARQPTSRRCPVVLDAFVAASFAGFIGSMLSAEAVQRGRSLFAEREGDEVAAAGFVLVDDGLAVGGSATAPFDGEGSARRRTPLIEGGILRGFLYDARSARRAGRASTANASRGSYRTLPGVGASNLTMAAGEHSFEQLLSAAGDGLYVTDVAGLHSGVNPISGTFSVGASGRLIEDGRLTDAVREVTIASDLVTMLRSVSGVGSQTRWVPFGGSVLAAPLLIAEMSVSGS